MIRIRAFVGFAGAVLLLSGCQTSPSTEPTATTPVMLPQLIPSDIALDSPPGFLTDPVDADHLLPEIVAESYDVDPSSAHYQGEFEGEAVYLYLVEPGDVAMLTFEVDDPGMSGGGITSGNAPTGLGVGDPGDDQWILQYVPQGTDELPDGWTALSAWIAWREL